jgi:hypothetical protein
MVVVEDLPVIPMRQHFDDGEGNEGALSNQTYPMAFQMLSL